jgi:hypothetical protein
MALVRLADRHGGASGVRGAPFAFLRCMRQDKPRLGDAEENCLRTLVHPRQERHAFLGTLSVFIRIAHGRINAENVPGVCPPADTARRKLR